MTPALDMLAAIRAALPPSNWGALADCDALERWIRDEPKREREAIAAAKAAPWPIGSVGRAIAEGE